MFEENENLVFDDTENVEEPTTEEIGDGVTDSIDDEQSEENPVKTYTEEELNSRVDELLAKKIARKEAKLRKEYEQKYSPYKEAESVLNAGMETSNISEATAKLREFYTSKGINIPQNNVSSYDENDLKVLAKSEANSIIESGYDEVEEEVDRLANKGVDKMTPREKLVFTELAEYRKAESSRKELASIGVKDEVINSKDFKDFTNQFNSNTPIKKVYELYTKTLDNKQIEKIGSMKNSNSKEEKTYYSPEEVDKLTSKELDDPNIFNRVRESMSKWK